MLNRIRSIIAFLAIGLLLAGHSAIGQDKAKDKDAKDKDVKKEAKDKGTPFKVVSVDVAKKTAVVSGADGKSQTIKIGDDVQFIGPRGGVSKEGIKDDRFVAGASVGIVGARPWRLRWSLLSLDLATSK